MLAACLVATAWASGRTVVDARVSYRQMQRMADNAAKGSDFPITVNEAVLKELNAFLGTPKGRAYLAKAMANLELQRGIFDRQLAEHRIPEELLAVGLIESAYANPPASANPKSRAAGVWQFIPATARTFGLRVDENVDERLDVEKETDAAFRYLESNKLRFNDWLLGVMSYNMGERSLAAAIETTGTRDAWKLVELGFEGDARYLAKFMAALLILKNPEVLK
jgi:hypothetical protein